jgi:hypothetical protein
MNLPMCGLFCENWQWSEKKTPNIWPLKLGTTPVACTVFKPNLKIFMNEHGLSATTNDKKGLNIFKKKSC